MSAPPPPPPPPALLNLEPKPLKITKKSGSGAPKPAGGSSVDLINEIAQGNFKLKKASERTDLPPPKQPSSQGLSLMEELRKKQLERQKSSGVLRDTKPETSPGSPAASGGFKFALRPSTAPRPVEQNKNTGTNPFGFALKKTQPASSEKPAPSSSSSGKFSLNLKPLTPSATSPTGSSGKLSARGIIEKTINAITPRGLTSAPPKPVEISAPVVVTQAAVEVPQVPPEPFEEPDELPGKVGFSNDEEEQKAIPSASSVLRHSIPTKIAATKEKTESPVASATAPPAPAPKPKAAEEKPAEVAIAAPKQEVTVQKPEAKQTPPAPTQEEAPKQVEIPLVAEPKQAPTQIEVKILQPRISTFKVTPRAEPPKQVQVVVEKPKEVEKPVVEVVVEKPKPAVVVEKAVPAPAQAQQPIATPKSAPAVTVQRPAKIEVSAPVEEEQEEESKQPVVPQKPQRPPKKEVPKPSHAEVPKPTSTEVDEAKAYQLFPSANEKFQKQDFAKAIEEYTEALKYYPDFARAYLFRGMAYLNSRQAAKAIPDFTLCITLVKEQPSNESTKEMHARAHFMRGKAYRQTNQLANALDDLNIAVAMYAGSTNMQQLSSMYMERALANDLLEQTDEAIADYSKFLEISEKQQSPVSLVFQALYNKSLAQIQIYEYEDAIVTLTKAITSVIEKSNNTSDKSYADTYYQRGKCYENLGKDDEAAKDYEQSLKLNPQHLRASIQLAYISYEKEDYARAIVLFTTAIRGNPNDFNNYFNRSMCHKMLKQWKDAEDDLREATKLNPKSGKAFVQLGKVLKFQQKAGEQGLEDEIIQVYTKAIQLCEQEGNQSELPHLYFDRAVTYNRMEQFEKAVEDLSAAVDLDPSFTDAFYNRGLIYHRELKDNKNAMDDYNAVLEQEPNDVDCLTERGVLFFELGLLENAEQDWNAVLQLDPENEAAKLYLECCKT